MNRNPFKTIDFKSFLKSEKGVKILVVVGIIGIALIVFSDLLFQKDEKAASSAQTISDGISSGAYAENLEKKLSGILSNIEGAGKVEVMITLVNGTENIYAYEEEKSSESEKETDENSQKESRQSETKQEVVLIESGSTKSPLIKTQMEPVIKGVIVSCQGASRASVKEMVINAVTTALDIPVTKVCVVTYAD